MRRYLLMATYFSLNNNTTDWIILHSTIAYCNVKGRVAIHFTKSNYTNTNSKLPSHVVDTVYETATVYKFSNKNPKNQPWCHRIWFEINPNKELCLLVSVSFIDHVTTPRFTSCRLQTLLGIYGHWIALADCRQDDFVKLERRLVLAIWRLFWVGCEPRDAGCSCWPRYSVFPGLADCRRYISDELSLD